MATEFEGKNIILGVTGGIAAYKAVELARLMVKHGADVKVIMTDAGRQFVTPLTFRTVTGNPVATSLWSDPLSPLPHISLSEEADLIVVAPATANTIARSASGVADDLLSTTLLAARGRVVFAPAMNTRMYSHPATAQNLARLREAGAVVVEPGEGELACGDEGVGRMAEPVDIMKVLEREITRVADLGGRAITVTAGPTREYIDPVRFLSNPSTGLMGYTIAERAARRGAEVSLISGPVSLPRPAGVRVIPVVSAAQMKKAVMESLNGTDALIMAAAVADYRPAVVAERKIKKKGGVPELRLEPTEDILVAVSEEKGDCVVVGFAAETDNVVENARGKLVAKDMDMVVANKVDEADSGFAARTNMAAVIVPETGDVELSMMSKVELADLLLDRVAVILG
ncbi:MAG: bifunctional phosphopantothenoylcysteine decarboxylase/phosphopantothenate--cysteine ligase CoaBC [Actinobacteria bacterium]|nr:bifunctional phosphopantothenoylcysteine decarboxylase/phosphopantothenate--cysteine ligase CoaBC [Actinomycetota bacterium]